MGKKRIKENSSGESSDGKFASSSSKNSREKGPFDHGGITRAVAHIKASYNNTRLSISDDKGNVLAWSSAGAVGFKGAKKSTPYAAARVADAVADKLGKLHISELIVLVRGVGSGRESAIRALANKGYNITLIKDITPIPHNGPRARKARRV